MLVVDSHPIRVTIETFAEYITRRLKSIHVGIPYKHANISTKTQEDVGLGQVNRDEECTLWRSIAFTSSNARQECVYIIKTSQSLLLIHSYYRPFSSP